MRRLLGGFTVAAALTLLFTLVTPLRAAAVQALALVTCASASACTGGNNTSTGPGVQGSSAKGTGVKAISSTGTGLQAMTSATNSGQRAILATASGSATGVRATVAGGTALSGLSATGFGLDAESKSNVGVFGAGAEGVEADDVGGATDAFLANGHGGNLMRANNRTGTDVFLLQNDGTATFTGDVIAGSLSGGSRSSVVGVQGVGSLIGSEGIVPTQCSGRCVGVEGANATGASSIAVLADGHGGSLFVGNSSSGTDVFQVDDGGNVHAHSFTADLAATQATSTGAHLTTYSSESRTPNIEDFGEATLTAGQAYVRLDSTFASGIDRNRPYLVFITPQGAVGGTLYVTQKTSAGFAVRAESAAVRPSVAFDYRIVARPYAKSATASGVSPGMKRMPTMRKSVTIPRSHPQSKTRPIH